VQKEIEAAALPGWSAHRCRPRSRSALAGNAYDLLASLGDDLRFVLICSRTTLVKVGNDGDEAGFVVTPTSTCKKCARCWHYRDDVGHDADVSRTLRPLHVKPARRRRARAHA
jgi:isoleucyl-tRNA synthetase